MHQSFAKWSGSPVGVGHGSHERRADERHVAVRRPAQLAAGEVRELCIVHNICTTALVAEIFSPRSIGEDIRIELSDTQHLDGTIVWASETNVEVRFREPIEVSDLGDLRDDAPQAASAGPPQVNVSCQGWLEIGEQTIMVEVCDLSQGGVQIAAHVAPPVGERTLLVIQGLEPIAGEVRWCSDGKLGIAFDEPVPLDTLTGWIIARDAQIGSHGQSRHWPRYSILLKTIARLRDVAEPVETIVHNISRGGVQITCRRGLRVGDPIDLGLGPAGDVAGRVVWIGGNDAGVAFTRTIDAGHVLHPLRGRRVAPVLHHHVIGRRPGLNSHKAH